MFKKNSLIVAICLVLTSNTAYAAGEGHAPSIGDTFIFWINFIVFYSLVFYLARKPAKKFWVDRKEKLYTDIKKSEIELEKANKLLSEATKKQELLSAEINILRNTLEHETELEVKSILRNCDVQKQNIEKQTVKTIELETIATKKQIQSNFAERVYTLASQKLKNVFTSDLDSAYRKKSFEGIKSFIK